VHAKGPYTSKGVACVHEAHTLTIHWGVACVSKRPMHLQGCGMRAKKAHTLTRVLRACMRPIHLQGCGVRA